MAKPKDFGARPNPKNGRYRLISANWKMNLNHLEAISTAQKLFYLLREQDYHYTEISIHPPFTDLRSLQLLFESDRMPLSLGAQNCSDQPSGAYTGEISAAMLARLSVKFVIVGHSERREYFGESDQLVAAKVKAVLASQMIPLICVGETKEERDGASTDRVVSTSVDAVVRDRTSEEVSSFVFAYEPRWAIGTGRAATPEDAQHAAGVIRQAIAKRHGETTANAVRVQYGGSVNAANAASFMSCAELDGLLVGGASLDPDAFSRIIAA